VHMITPGLTGWAQINGRDELPIPDKVDLDAWYLENKSFGLDMKIIVKTFLKAISREGEAH
jgi:O-antigen biosynthesis protein WbqP